jgi:cobalt-zinc-cadmium resistance protein CzcA
VRKLEAGYAPLLDAALRHPRGWCRRRCWRWRAPGAVPVHRQVLHAALDEGDIIMQVEKLPSISLEQSAATDLALQRASWRGARGRAIVARVGSDELGLDPMGLNETDSFLVLKPRAEWRFDQGSADRRHPRRRPKASPA